MQNKKTGGVPSTFGEARGHFLQEEGGVADFSEADRDAMEAREDILSMSVFFFGRQHVMPRQQLYVPKGSSFPIPST